MATAVAARINGDDYQALVFWKQACRLLRDEEEILFLEIESEDLKSLDDVVVHFKDSHFTQFGKPLKMECYQVKYHVNYRGCIKADSLIDPSFINATSSSFLQRAFAVWNKHGNEGVRIYFYSMWAIDNTDALAELVSGDDGHICVERMRSVGIRSRLGKVRESWMRHLGVTKDELFRFLDSLYVIEGVQKQTLADWLNNDLLLAGLRPVSSAELIHPYLELARRFITGKHTRLMRDQLLAICKRSNLWQGPPISMGPTKKIGVRSRMPKTTGFLEWATSRLDLVDAFDDRLIKAGKNWIDDVFNPISLFLDRTLRPGDRCEMWIASHGSIATAIGYILDAKAGVDVHVRQGGVSGVTIWGNPKTRMKDGNTLDCMARDVSINNGQDLAVAISVAQDIHDDVQAFIAKSNLAITTLRSFTCENCGSHAIDNQEQAVAWIEKVVDSIRKLKRTASRTATVHVFFAMPVFMSFALGQRIRPLGRVQLYEHNLDSGYGPDYVPSLHLPPKKGEP